MNGVFLPLIFCLLVTLGFSQVQPPPAAPSGSGQVKKFEGWQSVSSIPSEEPFTSLDGRFSIALPKTIQGFAPLSPKQTGSSATGGQFTWKFAEAEVVFSYLDFQDSALSGSTADLAQITTNSRNQITRQFPTAKLVSESLSIANGVPASYFMYDLGSNGFHSVQFFIHEKRVYRIDAAFKDRNAEKYLTSAFASFRLISQAEVDAEVARRYEAMKPPSLPQTPVVARLTTDAQDRGLKGKVRKVIEETEDLSGTWAVQGRQISSVEYYDQNGNLTQRDSFHSQGNPFEITVYGYLDGKRVSNSKTNNNGREGTFTVVGSPSPPTQSTPEKRDPRYRYSYEYKYENGKLVEMQMIYNNGRKGMRYVYKHSPNQVEELVYSDDGKLNQRYLSILDANGHEIERTNFGVVNFEIYGDRRYRFSYELDATGNWIKKTALKELKENGVTSWQPHYVSYRTITYY